MSNPAEVAKTRLQLQGELAKTTNVRVYNNVLDVFRKTFKNEGIRGVQRGLAPAVSLFGYLRHSLTIRLVCLSSKLYIVLYAPRSQLLNKDPTERFSTRSARTVSIELFVYSCRIVGLYEPFRRGINKLAGRPAEQQIPLTSVMAGASSGAVGGTLSVFKLDLRSYFFFFFSRTR